MFKDLYANKRVFVTGHTGFKGSWLTQWLLRLGAKVGGYSLYIPSVPSHFEVLGLREKIAHFEGDICNIEHLKGAIKDFEPEFVFHMAAQPIVRLSYEQPALTFMTNAMGTVNVLEALLTTPSVRSAVLITSDKCYENVNWEFGYRESDQLGGQDPYSASKACAEIIASSYMRSFFEKKEKGPRIATVRAGNVIGGGDWAQDRIVPDCMRSWASNEPALLRSPESTRPWQHVLEPLSGYLWLGAQLYADAQSVSFEAYNFGPDATINQTVGELVSAMADIWHPNKWQNVQKDNAIKTMKEASLLKLCCDKALHRLGWVPNLNFSQTVELTASWYKNFYNKKQVATDADIDAYEYNACKRELLWTKK